MSREEFAYTAFISYKRGGEDERRAVWLQRKLERYRIPSTLTPRSSMPEEDAQASSSGMDRRLKIFRDKTDLGSHPDLDQGLQASLDSCRFLIVVCSPRSAGSPYVAEEVSHFIRTGREEYIIPFIIEGSPVPAGGTGESCYPPTLPLHCLGITLGEGSREETLMKIIARLLQVDFAFLYQRHLRAQRRYMLAALAVVLAVLGIVSGLAAWAVNAEKRAVAQREEAEDLVEFMVGDMGEEAFRYVPLRTRRKITEKVESYYERWGRATSDAGLLYRARHSRNLAANARAAGKYALMREELRRAEAILDELLVRRPENAAVRREACEVLLGLFEAAWGSGDTAGAGEFVKKAMELAHAYAPDPGDPDGRKNAQSLLGGVYAVAAFSLWEQGKRDEALDLTRKEVGAREAAYALDPENQEAGASLSQGLLNLCTRLESRDPAEAETVCERSLELAETAARNDPFNQEVQERLIFSLLGSARVHFAAFRVREALDLSQVALDRAGMLAAHDTDSPRWQGLTGAALAFRGILLEFNGDVSSEEARAMIRDGGEMVGRYAATARGTVFEHNTRNSLAWYKEAHRGMAGEAADEAALMDALERARALARNSPGDARALRQHAWRARKAFTALRDTKPLPELLALANEAREAYTRCLAQAPSDERAALGYCNLLAAAGSLLRVSGHGTEAGKWFGEALAAAGRLKADKGDSVKLREALYRIHDGIGELRASEGRYGAAHGHFILALSCLRSALETDAPSPSRKRTLAMALLTAGNSHFRLGESGQGLPLLREGLATAREAEHAEDGGTAGAEGMRGAALPLYSLAAGVLGLDLCLTGEAEEGAALLKEGLRLARESGQPDAVMVLLRRTALALRLEGKSTESLRAAEEAAELAKRSLLNRLGREPAPEALTALHELGVSLLAMGRFQDALELASGALPLALAGNQANAGNAYRTGLFLCLKGDALARTGEAAKARTAYEEGLRRTARMPDITPESLEMGWGLLQARLLLGMGDALAAGNSVDPAFESHGHGLDLLRLLVRKDPRRADCRAELARSLERAAAAFAGAGRDTEARALRLEAERVWGTPDENREHPRK